MRIFTVTRDDPGYDEYYAYMVIVENIEDVLPICHDENFTQENSTIKEITFDGEPGILLSSYREG